MYQPKNFLSNETYQPKNFVDYELVERIKRNQAMDKYNNLVNNYKKLSEAEGKFLPSLEAYGNNWQNAASYDLLNNQSNAYYNQLDVVKKDLDDNAADYKYLMGDDEYNRIYDNITKSIGQKNVTTQYMQGVKDDYSNFKSREDYEYNLAEIEEIKNTDLEALGTQIGELEWLKKTADFVSQEVSQLEGRVTALSDKVVNNTATEAEKEEYNRIVTLELPDKKRELNSILVSTQNKYNNMGALESDLKKKKQFKDTVINTRELLKIQEQVSKLYQESKANEDWDKLSTFKSTAKTDGVKTTLADYGKDLILEYINGDKKTQGEITSARKADAAGLSQDLQGHSLNVPLSLYDWSRDGLDQLDSNERKLATYLYYKDRKKFDEYLKTMKSEWIARGAEETAKKVDGNFLLTAGYAVGGALDRFLFQSLPGLSNMITGKEEVIEPTKTQLTSQAIRQNLSGVSGFLYDVADTAAYMAPSLLMNMAAPGSGFAVTGLSAAGSAYNEGIASGMDVAQARFYGGVIGGLEAGLSYALGGAGNMLGKATKTSVSAITSQLKGAASKFIAKVGVPAFSEGLEEGLQEFFQPIVKNLVSGTDHEAEQINWENVGYSALLGFFTGGITQVPSAATNAVVQKVTEYSLGKSTLTFSSLEDIGSLAKEKGFEDIAEKLNKLSDSKSTFKVGKAVYRFAEQAKTNSIEQLKTALLDNGATEGGINSAQGWANQILNAALAKQNGDLPLAKEMILRNNAIAGPVYTDFVDNGKYGGDVLKKLNSLVKPVVKSVKGSKSKGDTTPTFTEKIDDGFSGVSDEALADAVSYYREHKEVPLHVLGANKGTSLYNALSAAGAINEDGTVNIKEIRKEQNRRKGAGKPATATEIYGKNVADKLEQERPAPKKAEAEKAVEKNEQYFDNLLKEKFDSLASKKAVKVAKSEWASVNSKRTEKYGDISSENIPTLDYFEIGTYNKVNQGYVYIIRNMGKLDFEIISKRKLRKAERGAENGAASSSKIERTGAAGGLDKSGDKVFVGEGGTIQGNDEVFGNEAKSDQGRNLDNGNDFSRRIIGQNQTKADSLDGSANYMPETEDAESDVDNDRYAKEDKFWQAENENEKYVSQSLLDKIKNLFTKESDSTSLGDIVKQIEKDFGVPISKGKIRRKNVYGIYKNKSEAIRTQVSNAMPTIAHELGHHLDKRYKLRNLKAIGEAIQVLKDTRPGFYAQYDKNVIPREAVAEFIRDYLTDRTLAKNKYPSFYQEFVETLSKQGAKDLENLNKIGDLINKYFVSDKEARSRAAVKTREQVKRANRFSRDWHTIWRDFQTRFTNQAAYLADVSESAVDLYDYSLKSVVRAQNNLTGYYMTGIDGDVTYLIDKDGNAILDENGEKIVASSLAEVFEDIHNEIEYENFYNYLIYKHALEFLKDGKRVYADDTINNVEFVQEMIDKWETKSPKFKDIAENFYAWQRTFLNEFGVKAGFITLDDAKALWDKYPCYVPFDRVVEENGPKGAKRGVSGQKIKLRKAKGSGLEIYEPISSYALKVEEYMAAADRNKVMQEIANVVDKTDGLGYLLERVPPQMAPKSVSTESIKSTIKSTLENTGAKTETVDTIYQMLDNAIDERITQFEIAQNQGNNIVSVYRNGKRSYYQAHNKGLLEALKGLTGEEMNGLLKIAGSITRVFKTLTTGGNAVWSLTSNAFRDVASSYKYSDTTNPVRFALDYVKALKDVVGATKKDKVNDYYKLYHALGGGYNSSLRNTKQLKNTVNNIIKLDKTMPKRVAEKINVLQKIESFSEAVETIPRLAEFKRVYEKTGDALQASLAAERITLNFNRRGSYKFLDALLPYFNASMQGTAKFLDNMAHNNKFRIKTVVSALITTALQFSWNMFAMGDDDNDEYEKLSAYQKNNFFNIYMGDGKFISIPKSKDTAFFNSIVERMFETAFTEDVEWAQEIKDFAAYTWLTFGPPMFLDTSGHTDVIGLNTAFEMATNQDFKGSPIVPSYLQKKERELQYDENTTWLAYGIGQIFGLSPMMLDHVIDSNLGWLGLLNRSFGKRSGEIDWLLGVGTKTVKDNAYTTDVLNHFYDNAEAAEIGANSYPEDGEKVGLNKQYSATRSILSALNKYAKEDEKNARDYKLLARDYADNFEKNKVGEIDKRLIGIYNKTQSADIFIDKNFKREYKVDKVEYVMDADVFMDYVDDYYSLTQELYKEILDMGLTEETTAVMLQEAKNEVTDLLDKKYKTGKEKLNNEIKTEWKSISTSKPSDYFRAKAVLKEPSTDLNANGYVDKDEFTKALQKAGVSKSLMNELSEERWPKKKK